MAAMTYRKTRDTKYPTSSLEAKNVEIRIHIDSIDSNILILHQKCIHFSEIAEITLTNVSFEVNELVIKCDLHSSKLKLATMESIDLLWKRLNQAIVQAFDASNIGITEITIHLNETPIEEEPPIELNECEKIDEVRKRIDVTNRCLTSRKKRCLQSSNSTMMSS